MRSVLHYDLETNVSHPGHLQDDRQRDIMQTRAFADAAAPFLSNPGNNHAQLDNLLGKINYYLDSQPPTPFRDAVLQVKGRVEAGRRGETPPPALPEDAALLAAVATPGRPAPDFVAPEFDSRQSAPATLAGPADPDDLL